MDEHARPAPVAEVWADERVVVRVSPIEGSGLFTVADIAAGTVVLRLGGRLMTSVELDALFAAAAADAQAPYIDTITVYDDAHLVLPPHTIAHFANHSCDPSLWTHGPYQLAARRSVATGDELTVDYGTLSGAAFVMDCHCGSPLCRGRVSSDDWRVPDLQRRYGDHWTPALLQRISDL